MATLKEDRAGEEFTMRTIVMISLFAGAFLQSPLAMATPCSDVFTIDELVSTVERVQGGVSANEAPAALVAAEDLRKALACLTDTNPPLQASAYRALGAALVVGGQPDEAERWFRSALSVDPMFVYGAQDVPEGHPVFAAYAAASQVGAGASAGIDGKVFVAGTHYVDGRRITSPKAIPGIPHVYVWEHDGARTATLIEGNAFPDEVLSLATAPVAIQPGPGKPIRPPTPPEQVALIAGGASGILGSGVLYFVATTARRDFDAARSAHDVDAAFHRTNGLVIASAAALAVGTGSLWFGVTYLSETTVPTIHLRF